MTGRARRWLAKRRRSSIRESDLVFNVVWTGSVFSYLRPFVASQMVHSEARFRFVANGCPPEQIELLRAYARERRDRVEVFVIPEDSMVPHGDALDHVRATHDDGRWFAMVDPDIKANDGWVTPLLDAMGPGAAVTSGAEVWSDDNVIPPGYPGVPGEFFYDSKGFVFGSPHLAIYEREALERTCDRWGVGMGTGGRELRPEAVQRLADQGHSYVVYDTAKIVNALLQADGGRLVHHDLDQLVHIGGLAHYLAPVGYRTTQEGEREPDWSRFDILADRHEVARYTARLLQARLDGGPDPCPARSSDPRMAAKLDLVRREVIDLVERYRDD